MCIRDSRLSIPTLKHWEINAWYSTPNEDFNGLSPRDYLRGKSLSLIHICPAYVDYLKYSGYILARMPFVIVLAPEAVEDLRRLTSNVRATVRTALEIHLRHQPERTSRSRIKRLRGLRRPQYRLRVGEVRVFYDVSVTTVQVLAIVAKSEAESWLCLLYTSYKDENSYLGESSDRAQ